MWNAKLSLFTGEWTGEDEAYKSKIDKTWKLKSTWNLSTSWREIYYMKSIGL